jgi:hypothetical protein
MRVLASWADALLRGRAMEGSVPSPLRRLGWLAACLLACGVAYGAVMGSYGGLDEGRLLQIVYSAAKVPLLLTVTFVVSLPSFFVLNTLLGVRPDFPEVLEALASAQAVLTLILVALSPYTALWYVSFGDYDQAVLFNGLMFALASGAAQLFLRRCYQPLFAMNPRHRALLRTWLGIYVFVGIQMAWVLRPFIGQPHLAVQFFREEAWGNAYVFVARQVWRVIAGE